MTILTSVLVVVTDYQVVIGGVILAGSLLIAAYKTDSESNTRAHLSRTWTNTQNWRKGS